MTKPEAKPVRCAIYTRKSTEEGLQQEFNTLDAQREGAEAYIASQRAEGWVCLPDRYDDGGFTGGNLERPAVQRLMADIEAGKVDVVIVYKVDRLSRSLIDFARMMQIFERHQVAFVSVTQQFNTTQSMGRLTLNILFSFAQFERELISERTRDKIAASRRKGKWAGGHPILGYDLAGGKLHVNEAEAAQVREIFELYKGGKSLLEVAQELNTRGWVTKRWLRRDGTPSGGLRFTKTYLWKVLNQVGYLGRVRHYEAVYPGEHAAILDQELWDAVQARLRECGVAGGTNVRNKHNALLKSLLFCRPCGRAMVHNMTGVKNGRAYRYYTCTSVQKLGRSSCKSGSLSAPEIEEVVMEQVRQALDDPEIRSRLALALRDAPEGRSEAHAAAPSDLPSLHERDQLSSALSGSPTVVQQVGMLTTMDGQITPAGIGAAVAAMGPGERRELVRLLVQSVEYDPDQGTVSVCFHETGLRSLGARAGTRGAA
ncbi:MAG: recombinase family protein [Phycisphaerales bacterium]|nr:recombinase family protein [Phycisphaerales bacterium]